MAELATIARPYAEALYQVARKGDVGAWASQLDALAAVAADDGVRQFADNPKVPAEQVYALLVEAAKQPLEAGMQNFLRTVIENGRLAALPAVAQQFQALVNAASGVSDAVIYSAFEITQSQVDEVVKSLEKRFGRKLNASVQVEPALIGGVRVVVGDEVLDTSVRARLDRMRFALTA
jgi:F-type H+-transporting ATPase subunit delta